MSRIGKKPVTFPKNVKVSQNLGTVKVEGPKGALSSKLPEGISMVQSEGNLVIERKSDERLARSYHGLARTLIGNMVTGVSTGFTRVLEIDGVGYRPDMSGKNLMLYVGYSHPVEVPPPDGISFEVDAKARQIKVLGRDKEQVGQVASDIRKIRPPEPYKGKGVHYLGEHIRRKAGKSGKTKGKK